MPEHTSIPRGSAFGRERLPGDARSESPEEPGPSRIGSGESEILRPPNFPSGAAKFSQTKPDAREEARQRNAVWRKPGLTAGRRKGRRKEPLPPSPSKDDRASAITSCRGERRSRDPRSARPRDRFRLRLPLRPLMRKL
ncbi:hypothetical protein KM043_002471 [Ampulex compressa]|nr:hypothetical protein KM043_002471 [Ampulex compressa]